MESDSLLVVGNVIEFLYPSANYSGALYNDELRRVRITAVRDLRDEPLELVTMMTCPSLRRGTVLVTGLDLDKGAERSFYVESMGQLKLASPALYNRKPTLRRYAVVESGSGFMIDRLLTHSEARAVSIQWESHGQMTEVVPEPINWPSDDQVLALLQLTP